jgi:hypothetical protein
VGTDVTLDQFSNVFAFFGNSTSNVNQSVQSLFRARKCKHMEISFSGNDMNGAQTKPQLMAECTRAKEHAEILPQLDTRKNGMINFNSKSKLDTRNNPDDLGAICETFIGAMWVADRIHNNRSHKYFPEMLIRSIEHAGVQLEVETITKVKNTPPSANKIAFDAAAELSETERYAMMAENLEQAIEHDMSQETATGSTVQDDATREQKLGWSALYVAKRANIDVTDLNNLPTDDRADWLRTATPIADNLARARRHAEKMHRGHAHELYTQSELVSCTMSQCVIDSMGIDVTAVGQTISADQIKTPEVLATCNSINQEVSIYGARKNVRGIGSPKTRVAMLNIALNHLGINLVSASAGSKKAPTEYRVEHYYTKLEHPQLTVTNPHIMATRA